TAHAVAGALALLDSCVKTTHAPSGAGFTSSTPIACFGRGFSSSGACAGRPAANRSPSSSRPSHAKPTPFPSIGHVAHKRPGNELGTRTGFPAAPPPTPPDSPPLVEQ